MTARQTIINVRSGQSGLSAEVASVIRADDLADGLKAAKRSQNARHQNVIRTTFCPICGGNKAKESTRCAGCRDAAMSRHVRKAADAGHKSTGRPGASRSLIGQAVTAAAHEGRDIPTEAPTWSHRVRGSGVVHRQAWDRKLMVDGVWVAESTLPESIERKRADDEAIRRLERVR